MNTVASPCPGPGLFSRHRNGMSLVVMRFLTLGSTLSIPNQLPKIISTGNAFLTSKTIFFFLKDLQIPSNDELFIYLFIYIKLACVWVLLDLWFSCYKLAQDIPEDVFFLYSVKVRGALVGDLFSESFLYHYSTKRGSHKRLMRRSGEGRVGRRAGSDEPQPKRKTHCFSSTGWEEGNSQLCRHNTAMDVHVGCEVRSCCDWQAGEEEKEMPLPPSYLTAQDRITDSGGRGEGKGGGKEKKDDKKNQTYLCRCCHSAPGIQRLGWYSGPLFTKTQINSDTMVMKAAPLLHF